MEAAHIIPRSRLSTRWLLANGVLLCYRCHLRWHEHPLAAAAWIRTKLGDAHLDYLRQREREIHLFNRSYAEQIAKQLADRAPFRLVLESEVA